MVKLMPTAIGPSKQFWGYARRPPPARWPVMEARGWQVTRLSAGSATPGRGGRVQGQLPAETRADPKYPAHKGPGYGEALECLLVEEAQSGFGPDPQHDGPQAIHQKGSSGLSRGDAAEDGKGAAAQFFGGHGHFRSDRSVKPPSLQSGCW